jgi:hypothetical protein
MRNLMAAAFAGGGRAGDGAADAPYSEEREERERERARELLHFSMESTLQELREREREAAHDSDHQDHGRRLDTAGKSLGSGSSKNESAAPFSLLVGSVRLGGTPVRLLLTQNIVGVLSASRTNDTAPTADSKDSHRGQNSSTIAAALSRNFHVKDNAVVGEVSLH